MLIARQAAIVYVIWVLLALAALGAMALERWSMGAVALATLGASMAPSIIAARYRIHLPFPFVTFTTLFIVAALLLGETFDFYDRYWWWDVVLHGGSAMGFGLVGFLFIFYLFEGDRYAAPAWAIGFFSWCFAVAIGAVWEIFEFAVDSLLGTNMLKSGLPDTMGDLVVNVIGAGFGAFSGYLYLLGRRGALVRFIANFIRHNQQHFRRRRR